MPSCFIAGKSDWGIYQVPGDMDKMQSNACTQMVGCHLVDGAGRDGDGVPGVPGETFRSFGRPVINAAGDLGVRAAITGDADDEGVWATGGGAVRKVVRSGDELEPAAALGKPLRRLEILGKHMVLGGQQSCKKSC